ncbi:MAG TPA: flagellar biosynthetic protein FliR [Edaphobacter sp.]|uniref:flagellar biosynthetic protein FliR n=1 Tax=Edaphobacter sp. TaxID=1934404 RepID=UPI002D13013B|nr:flagellar biosynthetic protein FliR [Edaphobacter sp.]HUZ94102.1 flagellar biosynthetic protein FliR [Edaphobacter sp.]
MITIPLVAIITALLTAGVRLSGLMLFAPFFGSAVIPARIKAILVLAMTILLLPTVGRHIEFEPLSAWPRLIAIEFLIGVGMGIATNLIFEAVQFSGEIVGIQMGYSLVTLLDPQTKANSSVMQLFYQSIVMLLFLRMDIHYWLLRAIGNSFLDLPPGSAHFNGPFAGEIARIVGTIFGLGMQIAAPVLAATLAADVVLGLLGKASPQMPVMLLGPAVKSVLGIFVLSATLIYWPDLFRRLFINSISRVDHLFHLAH